MLAAAAAAPSIKQYEPTISDDFCKNINPLAMSTASPYLRPEHLTRSIFEPGTELFDVDLAFKNNLDDETLLLMGVYKLPVSSRFMEELKFRVPKSDKTHINAAKFTESNGNLLPGFIGTTTKLSTVLYALPSISKTKSKRFIFVTSCRGISHIPSEVKPLFRKLVREYSLSLRENAPNELARRSKSILSTVTAAIPGIVGKTYNLEAVKYALTDTKNMPN